MVAELPTWHGTQEEGLVLMDALERNCECVYDQSSGERTKACPAHEAFAHSQRWLDGLVFERRIRRKLIAEEYRIAGRRH